MGDTMLGLLARRALPVAASVGLVLGFLASAGPAQASATPRWRVWYTSRAVQFTDIAATGPREAWAVGYTGSSLYVVRWNGSRWRPTSVPGSHGFIPSGIQATSSGNVWILGDPATGLGVEEEALVLDGSSWHAVTLPTAAAVVVGDSDVWGLGPGDGCADGSRPACSSQVWHWSNGVVTSYQVAGLAAGIAGARGHAWILSQRAIRDLNGPHMSSLPALYEGDGSGVHQVAAPVGRIGVFPQIAASPKGQLWVLAPAVSRHRQDALDAWNGHQWITHGIPAASKDLFYGSWGFTYDDHDGVWLGPYTHWTGHRWIRTDPGGPTTAYELNYVTAIPGSASAWAVAFSGAHVGRRTYAGLITLYGARP
jgi:hypothetical protein